MMPFMASSRWELGSPASAALSFFPGLRMVTCPDLAKGLVSFKGG